MATLAVSKGAALTWLVPLAALLIFLAACDTGVSKEEFDAVERDLQAQQARVQGLEAEAKGLQRRLNQGATLLAVLDTILAGFEESGGPSAEAILEFTALVQASGDPALQSKWAEVIDSVLKSAGPTAREAVLKLVGAVQASGNPEVRKKVEEAVVAAIGRGEGGAAFIELAALVQASGDPSLKETFVEGVGPALEAGEPPEELFGELRALVRASGNPELQRAFSAIIGPPPELLEEVGAKLKAVGDPSVEALFEEASRSPGEEAFDALFGGLSAALNRTLGGVDTEVQRYFETATPIFEETRGQLTTLDHRDTRAWSEVRGR